MRSVAVGEVTQPVRTWNPRGSRGVLTYIDLSAVDQDAKEITGARPTRCDEAPSRARQLVEEGDVLVSTVRPNLNGVARVPTSLRGATASTGFTVLRPRPALDGAYLFHWVRSPGFVAEMVKKATGASYPAVSDAIVRSSAIPLPSLAVQRRIATILDQADALRTKRHASLASLVALTEAVHLGFFGHPTAEFDRWPSLPIGEVCSTTSGGTPNREVRANYGGSIPWVKSGELRTRLVLETEEAITEDGLRSSSAKLMPAGTVLLAMYGATAGVVSRLGIPATTNQAVCCITPGPRVNPEYLVSTLRLIAPALLARRSGGAQPNLSQGMIRSTLIPVPPMDVQTRFAECLGAAELTCLASESQAVALDSLFAFLQDRAFKGEL